ncbi:hypothetical protein OAE19_02640 [Porticoccaceae bacterium]|nr:hypothetical protein [Porticoccaceae bacterium]
MKRLNTLCAIALCLVIGLASVTASAHIHNDHHESSCSVSVLQHSSAALAAETSKTYITRVTTPKTIPSVQAVGSRIRNCQLARAPPFYL